MSNLRVLIVGGGIAGTSLAFWLSKLGHAITVIERATALRTTGLQLDLRGHGIEVMKRSGLEPDFRKVVCAEQGSQLVDKHGKRWAYFPVNRTGKGVQSFSTEWEVMRGDICRIFHDAGVKHGAEYVFGTSVKEMKEDLTSHGPVEVTFANGREEKFDLVVGADGVHSRTRKMMLGPDKDDGLIYLGDTVAYFTVPMPVGNGQDEYAATFYLGPGRRTVMTRRNRPDRLQVYLGCSAVGDSLKAARHQGMEAEKKIVYDMFKGAGWIVDEVLELMMETDDFFCEHLGVVKIDSWSKGRIALVGDAAYCPSPNSGMGTSSSIVGSYILAGEISRHCSVDARGLDIALNDYETKFRPFMEQVIKGIKLDGPKDGGGMFPSSPLAIAITNRLVGLASFLKLDILSRFFFQEQVKDWDLPDYEDLLRDNQVSQKSVR